MIVNGMKAFILGALFGLAASGITLAMIILAAAACRGAAH
jgi:hypothetical protein